MTRIGSGPEGADEIKKHPWFKNIDFGLLELRRFQPPWKPNLDEINALSQNEIGDFFYANLEKLTQEEQDAWKEWDFNSKSVIQAEVVELLMWEDKVGPCQPTSSSGCCTIL